MKNLFLSKCRKTLSLLLTAMTLLSTISGQVFAANPKVSIIIPVYNTPEKLLRDCLESSKNQTLKDIEIICVDDGSTNGVGKILDKYAKDDPRFKVIHQENGGTCVARDKGLDLAKGEYVKFLDHDDTLHTQMLEKYYEAAKSINADVAINQKCSKSNCLQQSTCWNSIYKTKFLNCNNIRFKGLLSHSEDFSFNFLAAIRTNKIAYLNTKLYFHIDHELAQTNTIVGENVIYRYINNLNVVYLNCKKNGLFNNNHNKIRFLNWFLFMNGIINHINRKYCNKFFDTIAAIGPELLQDDVINLLPLKERQQLRNIIQSAKSE